MEKRKITLFNILPVILCGAFIARAFLFASVMTKKIPFDSHMSADKAYNADFEWTDMSGNSVSLPYSSGLAAGQSTTISATLPSSLEDNMVVFVRADQVDITVFVDNEARLSYSTKDTRLFGRISARNYLFVPVDASDANKTITIEVETCVDGLGQVDVLQYGLKDPIEKNWIMDSISDVIVAVVMIVICILSLIVGLVLSISYKKVFAVVHLAVMGILASVWILCNAEISQIYFVNSDVSTTIDYVMLLLLPFPFLFFMNETQKYRNNTVFMVFEYIAVVNTLVCMTLQILSIFDLAELFFVIIAVFGSTLIMILITTCIDIFKKKDYSYIIVAIGIFVGIIATIVQVILFIGGYISFGGKTVAYALLIILLTTIIDTFIKVRKTELENQIAVAQGKAEGRFLANMSHEIRTPINAVLGMNEMVLRESKEESIREYAQNIDSSGRMLLSIINDILDFSKVRNGDMKILSIEYSLTKLVNEISDIISPRAMAKSLIYQVNIDNSLPDNLLGDDVRVKQIIINLLSNAVKYTETGSVKLDITGQKNEDNTETLKISVIDTGKGIKEEDKASLFEAFTRVDEKNNRNIEGTGLGLALVSQLISAMKGTIDVESTYGKGSSFIVTLPQGIANDITVEQAKAQNSDKKEKKQETKAALFKAPTAKILVVDDTPVNLFVVEKLLKRTEINITTAPNGEECIRILKDKAFDVVLLDHLMPVMDGVEALGKIKNENLADGTPIIMLTANALEGTREQFLSMGFDDYLSKPINPTELESILMKYIPSDKIIRLSD